MKRTKQSTFAKRERQEQGAGFAPVGGAQFTPGPWYVHSNKIAVGDRDNDRHIIADIRGMEAFGNPTPDATLIAAAPAMYTLLQDATLQLARLTGSNLETYARTFSVLAKKALAQAEGRQG